MTSPPQGSLSSSSGEITSDEARSFPVRLGNHGSARSALKVQNVYRNPARVEFSPGKVVLNAIRIRPAFGLTIVAWLVLHLLVMAVIRIALGQFVLLLGIPNPLLLLLIWAILRVTICRSHISVALDPSACTAHYLVEEHFVVIKTPEDEWIDMETAPADEEAFVRCMQRHFGNRFFIEEIIAGPTGDVALSSPRPTERSAICRAVAEILSRETNKPEEEISEDFALRGCLAEKDPDSVALREALESEFEVVFTDEDARQIKTVRDVVESILRQIASVDLGGSANSEARS